MTNISLINQLVYKEIMTMAEPTVEEIIKWLNRGKVTVDSITEYNQKQNLAVYWQLALRSRKQ